MTDKGENKMKRTICLLILASLLLTASCGETSAGNVTTEAPENTTAATEKEEEKYLDGLDFNNRKVTVFTTDYENTKAFENTYTAESTGEVVNDAIYDKNKYVEELLNVELEFIEHDFEYGSRDGMYNAIRTSVMSDSSPYDIVLTPTYFTSTLVAEGLLADLNLLVHLDFSREWWSQGFIETATIDGKTYMAGGDGLLPFITGMFCMSFNKTLAGEYSIGKVYDIVNSGEWTVDMLHELTTGIYKDLNGDGSADENDRYGLEVLNPNFLLPFLTSCELEAFKRDGDKYSYNYGSERCVDAFNRVFALLHDPEATYMITANPNGDIRTGSPFAEGRTLFTTINLVDLTYYRDSKFEYGVVPYPKFDEAQENYRTMVSNGIINFSVPVTNAGDEAIGAVIEAMGYAGLKFTTPAYFETALKIKYAHDDETSQMLDLIKNAEYTSLSMMFAAELSGPDDIWKTTLYKNANEGMWASTAESNRDTYMTKLENFIETVKALSE